MKTVVQDMYRGWNITVKAEEQLSSIETATQNLQPDLQNCKKNALVYFFFLGSDTYKRQ